MRTNFIHKCAFALLGMLTSVSLFASSHREAPLIADDPVADNVDVYAFRSPDDPNTVTLIATYIPGQLPHGGPNYYHFGEDVRYEIHIDNNTMTPGDDIVYRFTFTRTNEDPTTFFNIRLGMENLKTTYRLERITNGGDNIDVIVENGVVPAPNIGPRSIQSEVGLNQESYEAYSNAAVTTATSGETVFAGPVDDPFFVDLGGIFDLGDSPRQDGDPIDGLACFNTSAIVVKVPIQALLPEGANFPADNILDPTHIIGVWASASRPAIRTLQTDGSKPVVEGGFVQVSRLGMPLTNEAVIPIGLKDYWNALSPYDELADTLMDRYFYNPELALYMDDDQFGGAVPAFAPLRVQTASQTAVGPIDFSNGADGLFALTDPMFAGLIAGTAFDPALGFQPLLLPGPGKPRSADLWPIFHTGVPNLAPYQLATGKTPGNPLTGGKPFINNFLPNGGDMLRLNMAVPVTARDDADFSTLGLVQAAVLGLTDDRYNGDSLLQFIPNMDGFPNGRRLEDDVTRIELQAVSGVVLAAVGLFYDDYVIGESPVTPGLTNVLGYTTGVEENDKAFRGTFPYLALPASGKGECSGAISTVSNEFFETGMGNSAPSVVGINFPNPFSTQTTIKLRVRETTAVSIDMYDLNGRLLKQLARETYSTGEHLIPVNVNGVPQGTYLAVVKSGSGRVLQTIRMIKSN